MTQQTKIGTFDHIFDQVAHERFIDQGIVVVYKHEFKRYLNLIRRYGKRPEDEEMYFPNNCIRGKEYKRVLDKYNGITD